MLAAGGLGLPSLGHVANEFGTGHGPYVMQTAAAAITPESFSEYVARMGNSFRSKASYGAPTPITYTPALSGICLSPSTSSAGTYFDLSTPALTASDELSVTDHSILYYGGSDTAFDVTPTTMSVVEESMISKALRSASASIIPSLLTGSAARSTAPPTPDPSYKQHPSRQTSSRKRVSSTSARANAVIQKRKTKPRNPQMHIGEPGPDGRIPCLRDGDHLRCPGTNLTTDKRCTYRCKREMDMRRHMETHRAETDQKLYFCCGVPVEQAAAYGIEASSPYLWNDLWMVGGCAASFSRKDSLLRHLNGGKCKGNVGMSSALLGMQRGAALVGPTAEGGDE